MGNGRVRFAIAGLGHIGRTAILPAFARTPSAELATVISGDPVKRQEICAAHGLAAGYSFDEFERALLEQRCDAVFVAVPNHLHREYSERAAAARVHVLCEKPLVNTVEDAVALRETIHRSRTKLMVGYRHHFSSTWREAIRIIRDGTLGEIRSMHSLFTVSVRDNNIRIQKAAGGGTLPDIGIYCINTTRRFLDAEPVKLAGFASARPDDPRFKEVEESFTAVLEFPRQTVATFTCAFGSTRVMTVDVIGTQGRIHLDPFYDYKSDIRMEKIVDGVRESQIFPRDEQFANQIEYFARCILEDTEPAESVEEALADTRVMEDLYRSAAQSSAAGF